jgi:lysine--tRNA ligase
MGNGYSELNDPLDQLARFEEQQAMRDGGDSEAQMLDQDFVEMLEYGMPPACGWGNSERNFWLLEGVSGREAVPFPIIKRRANSETISEDSSDSAESNRSEDSTESSITA